MKTTSPILTISMLISGKEDMPKSLASLCYFKDAIPCEIILVDTGCSPEQRALAERYADKIVDFVWCNDFAAARNAGLKEATGEWFLYLDDDEWFENPGDMVAFFTSGEYKRYNSATYMVRNYFTRQGNGFNETAVTRMIRRDKNTVFVGRIHEYLYPFMPPIKNFLDFVHHYGYAFKDDDAKRRHAERNIRPLLEMIQEEPHNVRWKCQLAQEYFVLDDYEETVRVCKEGVEQWETLTDEYRYDLVGAIYAFLLISLESMGKFEEEEQWLEKALGESKMPEATHAYFYLAGIRMYGISGSTEYEKCRKCVKEYLKAFRRLQGKPEIITLQTELITSSVFQEHRAYPALLLGMGALIRLEDYALAEEAFYLIDWSDKRMLHQNQCEKVITDACCSVPYHPLWSRMMQTLVSREEGMKEMYVVFLETEISYKQQNDQEKLARLYRLAASLTYEHRYLLGCQILWTARNPEIMNATERKQRLEELFVQFFKQYAEELFEVKTEIWKVAERMEISMEENLLQLDYRMWKRSLEKWIQGATEEKLSEWEMRLTKWKTQEDIRYGVLSVKCREGHLLCKKAVKCSLVVWEECLWQYADAVIGMYEPYYKETVVMDAIELLPDELQLALALRKLQDYRRGKDDRAALMQIKKCISIYQPLETVLCEYAQLLKEEIQKEFEQRNADKAELENLAVTLKTVAKLRMERGEWEAAEEILRQLQACMPEDEEVGELLHQYKKRKNF